MQNFIIINSTGWGGGGLNSNSMSGGLNGATCKNRKTITERTYGAELALIILLRLR